MATTTITITLDALKNVISLAIGRQVYKKTLILFFKVSKCDMINNLIENDSVVDASWFVTCQSWILECNNNVFSKIGIESWLWRGWLFLTANRGSLNCFFSKLTKFVVSLINPNTCFFKEMGKIEKQNI